MDINLFIKRIPGFENLSAANKIDYFVYFLLHEKTIKGVLPKDVLDCFHELNLNPYSNISSYLNKNSQRRKNQKFLKRNNLFFLESGVKGLIEKTTSNDVFIEPSNDLFPISIFDDTRKYLLGFAKEAAASYDYGLYNSCFFMLRKILETLIIELFERHSIDNKIKNNNGGYLFLSDLISKAVSENTWHLTKISREDMPKLKKLADSSVHSKRFSAKKIDIENIKTEIRIIFQELISLIDYPAWK